MHVFADGPKIVSLENQFKLFWKEASGKTFKEQVKLWDKMIEKDNQDFYDSFVWRKKSNPKWQEMKEKRLRKIFEKYPSLSPNIFEGFKNFPKLLGEQIEKYRKVFPDAKFDLPIYAVPAVTFNGKAGSLDSTPDKTILAFGIDVIVNSNDNADILYSHELFHIYHTDLIGVNEKVFTEEGKLTLPLWLEGLATYVSSVFNPQANNGALLFDTNLGKVSPKDVSWLSNTFLKEANEKALDQNNPELYMKWFGVSDAKVRADLPNRTGYLLGLQIVRHLSKKYSLNEMAQWKIPQVHDHVLEGLKALSAN